MPLYSQLTIQSNADRYIRVMRETYDNTSLVNSTLVNALAIPPMANMAEYEVRFTPLSGDVSNIIQNDADTFKSMNVNRRLIFQQVKESGGLAGNTTKSVQVQVTVRKISNPADMITGVVGLSASVDLQAPTIIPADWDNLIFYAYAEGNAGGIIATSTAYFATNGSLRHQLQTVNFWGNANDDNGMGVWLPSGRTVSEYEGRVSAIVNTELAGSSNTQSPGSPTPWSPMTNGLRVEVTSSFDGSSGNPRITVQATVELRRIASPSEVIRGTIFVTATCGI